MTTLLDDLFIWILSTSAMASVLVLLIFTVKWLMKDKLRPRWAYLLWMLLALRLLLPWAPESSFSIFNTLTLDKLYKHDTVKGNHSIASKPGAAPEIESVSEIVIQTQPTQAPVDPIENSSVVSNSFMVPPAQSAQATVHPFENSSAVSISFMQIGSWIWLSGAVLFLGFILAANLRFVLKIKKESPINNPRISSIFEKCKDELNVTRNIALIKTNQLASPTLVGVFKPKLLMPEAVLHTLNEEELRYVFLHELAHVKRNDIAANWLMNVLLTLHWFNPLLWYAYYKMREDQEMACDALALTRVKSEETKDYAFTIIKLLETLSRPVHLAGATSISGNKNELKRRIMMIASFTKNSYKWSLLGLAVILLLSGCVLTNGKSSGIPQAGEAKPNETVAVKPSAVNPDFPVPDDAVLTKGEAKNPNIKKYARYSWQKADEIGSISEPYLKEIEASGWKEKKSEQMGALRYFEKDGTVIGVTTMNRYFTVSELKKDNTNGQNFKGDSTSNKAVATATCQEPPKTFTWNNKTYTLKSIGKEGEPVMKLGYLACDNGNTWPAEGENATVNIYSSGSPLESSDLLYFGKWGSALYSTPSIKLDFSPVSINELKQGNPKKGWKRVRSLAFGDTQLHLYVDANNKEPYHSGSVYAFIEQLGKLYEIGDVGVSYGLDGVKVQSINKTLTNGKQEYLVIGGIGTSFTEWTTIGYDKEHGRLISIPAIGRPQIVDLDHDGNDELAAVFDGTHLNPPDVYILRGNNGFFELADIVKSTGAQYAKLNEYGVIEVGKKNDEPLFYRYKEGKIY